MNLRAPSLFLLPALALLATGCATSSPTPARSTEVDDVYFSSADRIAPRYAATASTAPAYDPTAPPAADGSVANPDYNGQSDASQQAPQQDYYGGSYAATPRVTSPYYGSFNQYNSGYAYDPFWSGSSLAIGCGPAWGWGVPVYGYAPIWGGPRVRFGVSFGYGWGYSSWAAPMYGWAGPTFYDPFYDPFWGPSYGYGYYGGAGYYGGGYYGGYRNGYAQGFYDGVYAGNGGYRNGRRVVYGPRLDRSADRGATAYSGGGRTSRRSDERTVTAGAGTSGYQPASSGYGGGASRISAPSRVATGAASATPAYSGNDRGEATRVTGNQPVFNQAQPQHPAQPIHQSATREQAYQPLETGRPLHEQQPAQPRITEQAPPRYQPQPQVAPPAAPQSEQRGGFFQRAARSTNESNTRPSAPTRTYSAPEQRSSGGNFGGGGVRGGSGNNGGARRSR